MAKEGKFAIVDKDGNKIECDVLFTFESEETHKNYIVYTDNTKDAQGNTKVYASIYDPKNPENSLVQIENEEEWQVIESILEEIKKGACEDDEEENKIDSDEIEEILTWLDKLPSNESGQTMDDSSFNEYLIEKRKIIDDINGDSEQLKGVLDDIQLRLVNERRLSRIDSLFELLSLIEDVSSFTYSNIAMKAYEKHNYPVSETAFRKAIEKCSDNEVCLGYKNNLAYLIRRGEIRNPDERSTKEIVVLLREGTKRKHTFSLINMALLWALEFGSKNDWKMADDLARLVDQNDLTDALHWWFNVANEGETEGYLVHLLMVRHGKIKSSPLGNIDALFDRVKKDYPRIPDEMKYIVTAFDGMD